MILDCGKKEVYFVGTVLIENIPQNWKPEGLAVKDHNTIIISESTSIYLLKMHTTFNAGQLVQLTTGLTSPTGVQLFNSALEEFVLVADGTAVKQICIETKDVTVIAQGFKKAFDISLSEKGILAVSDVHSHTITLLKKTGDTYSVDSLIGTPHNPGCQDGPYGKEKLREPTGLYDLGTLISCSFGGEGHGCIQLSTGTAFATKFMTKVCQLYEAIGFLPKADQYKSSCQRSRLKVPFNQI